MQAIESVLLCLGFSRKSAVPLNGALSIDSAACLLLMGVQCLALYIPK